MGRFFQAKPIELSEDNIYQPPFELMMAANEYGNNEMQQTADKLSNTLKELDFRYKDFDTENANKIKQQTQEKINNITDMLVKNPDDTEARKLLNNTRKDMTALYQPGGAIYNIQKTYDVDAEFKKQLDDDKTLSEDIKKRNYEGHLQKFRQQNPNGSVGTHYTPGAIVEDKEYDKAFGEYFKAHTADITARTRENLGYKWNTTIAKKDEHLILKQGMKMFMDAYPEYKENLISQANSGFFNDRNILLTDDGKDINYTKGFGKALQTSAESYNYNRELEDSITKEYNQNYEYENNIRLAAKAAKEAEESRYAGTTKASTVGTDEKYIANQTQFNANMDKNYRSLLPGLRKFSDFNIQEMTKNLTLGNKTKKTTQEQSLYESAVKTRSMIEGMINGRDVKDALNKMRADVIGKTDTESKRKFAWVNKLALDFNQERLNFKGKNIENNWANLKRFVGNTETNSAAIVEAWQEKATKIADSNIEYYNRAKDVIILDENDKRVNKANQSIVDFMSNNRNFDFIKSGEATLTKGYNVGNHRTRYIPGTIGPLTNEGGLDYTDIEYEMRDNNGKVFRVQVPWRQTGFDVD